jgi:manganese transport protein
VGAERDLAQACSTHFSRPVALCLWLLSELAIIATDLAEVIGSAVAFQLLFGLSIVHGVLITVADVLVVLVLESRSVRWIELIVSALALGIAIIFAYELSASKPDPNGLARGLLPSKLFFEDSELLFVSAGILGATVMPHNLYLHSSIVQTRNYARTATGKAQALRWATVDSTLSLIFAFFINASILLLSAAAFHGGPNEDVADIRDAYQLLSPTLGDSSASMLFALGLLFAGQSSTLTGTLAGQIVMEGFIGLRMRPYQRRLLTRLLAVVPALVVAAAWGEQAAAELLVVSQVVLSLQLPFAVWPLIYFTSRADKVGHKVANGWPLTILLIAIGSFVSLLNAYLVVDLFRSI